MNKHIKNPIGPILWFVFRWITSFYAIFFMLWLLGATHFREWVIIALPTYMAFSKTDYTIFTKDKEDL